MTVQYKEKAAMEEGPEQLPNNTGHVWDIDSPDDVCLPGDLHKSKGAGERQLS